MDDAPPSYESVVGNSSSYQPQQPSAPTEPTVHHLGSPPQQQYVPQQQPYPQNITIVNGQAQPNIQEQEHQQYLNLMGPSPPQAQAQVPVIRLQQRPNLDPAHQNQHTMTTAQQTTAILGGIALMFYIISLATLYWLVDDDIDVHLGLFRVSFGDTSAKLDLWSVNSAFAHRVRATRAFVIMALLVTVAGIGLTASGKTPQPASNTFVAAAALGLLGSVIYTGARSELQDLGTSYSYGYSFSLCIMAFFFCLLASYKARRAI
eukprot:m.267643 g.267643  ORF g.267643 m.267643 type:complete len:262 (+) comp17642_c0_seq1:68-853(+)